MATENHTKSTTPKREPAAQTRSAATAGKQEPAAAKASPKTQNKSQSAPANGGDEKRPFSEREVKLESSKAARQAQIAQKQAIKYREAAYGAGDPDERQKLLEKAIDKEVEAESFGKTAKYLRSGTFQGMIVGTGLGVIPGITLGTVVGLLVGGVVSLITGGLGAGLGALTGWLHGPFWNVGEVVGKTIRKITGDLPGWKATERQKQQLEAMLGQIKEEDMPDEDELEYLRQDDGSDLYHSSWARKAYAAENYVPNWLRVWDADQTADAEKKQAERGMPPPPPAPNNFAATQKAGDDLARHYQSTTPQKSQAPGQSRTSAATTNAPRKKPRKLEVRSNSSTNTRPATSDTTKETRKAPRKLEQRS